MPITASYYRITIAASGSLTLGGVAPADGFFDDIRGRFYDPLATTSDQAFTKERGWARWLHLLSRLSENCNIDGTLDIVKTQATPINENAPTAIAITVVYPNVNMIYTYDELNPGQFLTGIPAITRMVGRACSDPQPEWNGYIYYQGDAAIEQMVDVEVAALYTNSAGYDQTLTDLDGCTNITVTAIPNTF